jgi:hypothetical protein
MHTASLCALAAPRFACSRLFGRLAVRYEIPLGQTCSTDAQRGAILALGTVDGTNLPES